MSAVAEAETVPVAETWIDDTETPVSAFLKLRAAGAGEPCFLLESADYGRVGRYSFIGYRPRKVLRWSLGDPGDPYALAAARTRPWHTSAGRPGAAAVRRRRRRHVRLRPGAHGRAARRAQPGPARAARPGADADRHAGRLRPPQAHDHGRSPTLPTTPRTRPQRQDRRGQARCWPARCRRSGAHADRDRRSRPSSSRT